MTKTQTKFQKFWSDFKLRFKLFRLWFVKNISVFVKLFFLICIILIFSGNITENTPVLGVIFGGLSVSIREELTGIGTLVDILTAATSILVTIGIFTAKAKSLALSDIKNTELKKALIKAGLYFNSDGKLTKKIEKVINIDLNNDGKIDEEDLIPKSENLFQGIKRAGEEFVTILKANFDNEEKYPETLEKANLIETKEALNEVEEHLESNSDVIYENVSTDVSNEIIEAIIPEATEEIKVKNKNFIVVVFKKINDFFKRVFTKKTGGTLKTSDDEFLLEVKEEITEAITPEVASVVVDVIEPAAEKLKTAAIESDLSILKTTSEKMEKFKNAMKNKKK